MKYPERKPRNEPSLEKYNYYDHEDVIQENGTIANFTWCNDKKDKGWVFNRYKDKFGFSILEEEHQKGEYIIRLVSAEIGLYDCEDIPRHEIREIIEEADKNNEELHAYQYGDILSMRGGYYITPKNEPNRILKILGTRMS